MSGFSSWTRLLIGVLMRFLSVEECLRTCGLEEYAEATIGSLGIEYRKRTTIGVELAAKVVTHS